MDKLEKALESIGDLDDVLVGVFERQRFEIRVMLTPLSEDEIEKLKRKESYEIGYNQPLNRANIESYNNAIYDIAKDYWLIRK